MLKGQEKGKWFFSGSVVHPEVNPLEQFPSIEGYVAPIPKEHKLFFIVRYYQIVDEICMLHGLEEPFIHKNS